MAYVLLPITKVSTPDGWLSVENVEPSVAVPTGGGVAGVIVVVGVVVVGGGVVGGAGCRASFCMSEEGEMSTEMVRVSTTGTLATLTPSSIEAAVTLANADPMVLLTVLAMPSATVMAPSMLTDADVTVSVTAATLTDAVAASALATEMYWALPVA